MHCVTYISKVACRRNGATIPVGLAEVSKVSLAQNKVHQISGLLAYRSGYYLGILEGKVDVIDALLDNIKRDERHEELIILIDEKIRSRCFGDWSINISGSLMRVATFRAFLERHSQNLSNLQASQTQLLNVFCETKKLVSDNPEKFHDKELKITRWPEFWELQESPGLLDLCALLTNKAQHYDTLLEIESISSSVQLDDMLLRLDELEVLQVNVVDPALRMQHQYQAPVSRFFSKMKRFLNGTERRRATFR